MPSSSILDVELAHFPKFEREDGTLFVMETNTGKAITFIRTFVVKGQLGALRGQHAHHLCRQLFVCLNGICQVTVDDGVDTRSDKLASADTGLFVPAGLWTTQKYISDNTILLVLCDRHYEKEDYIDDRAAFLDIRGVTRPS